MLIQTKHILTMLVVAGISVSAFPAKAATFVAGDVLLGFRVSGGAGAGTDTIVNLGQADTIYRDATSNIASVVDLSSVLSLYGASGAWANRSDLTWGAVAVRSNANTGSGVGNDGDPARTNYLTTAQTAYNPGTQTSTALEITSGTSRGTVANNIVALNTLFSGTTAAGTVGGLDYITIGSSDPSSWTSLIANSNFGLGSPIEASSASGIDATGLDLYRILHISNTATPTGTIGVGSWEGTFKISSAGVVGFDVNAVPEPSRAVLAALGLGGLLLRRRRSLKA